MTVRVRSFLPVIGLVAAFAAVAHAQTPTVTDAEFVTKATVGNTFEIEESKLALQRATNPQLKQFAQHMVEDHSAALEKLAHVSGKPARLMLDPPHQAMLDNLGSFQGTDFDKIYQADQVASHAETVALLSDYSRNGRNSDLKSWAKSTLPVVMSHRATIDAM